MSKLYLYNYNNYFNKIFKKEDTLALYGTPLYTLPVTNFNYNDGVDTSHVINYDPQNGNYLIITDNNNVIQSRWFVTENVRTRGGQHSLTLRRDLLVDLHDLYINNPMLIHRGMVQESSNPLLFNPEGFSFNQVKTQEVLLKDTSGIPWYVLYFNDPSVKTIYINDDDLSPDAVLPGQVSEIEGIWTYISNCEGLIKYQTGEAHGFHADTFKLHIPSNNPYTEYFGQLGLEDVIWFDDEYTQVNIPLTTAFTNQYSVIKSKILTTEGIAAGITQADYEKYLSYNNKLIKDSNGDYYYITVTISNNDIDEKYYDEDDPDNDYTTYCKSIINGTGLERTGDWGDSFGIRISRKVLTISATAYVDNETITINNLFESTDPDKNPKVNTLDSDYRIIAIPADDFKIYTSENTYTTTQKNLLQKAIKAIMLAYPAAELIDVQYLPYSPIQKFLVSGGSQVYNLSNYEYEIFESSDTTSKLPVFYIENANLSFNINQSFKVLNYDNPSSTTRRAIDYKIANETTLYRLVSPNYNGNFEFSVAKNHDVDYFNVDMTLKPISPYIHVNPNFKGLYGDDFNDARGLICQGDFSLPIHTDQFVEYEYRNRNYANAFERQIEKLDFDYSQERIRGAFGLAAGTVAGGVAGAIGGAKVGGPVGAAVGGAIGTAASLAGGIVDYSMLTSKQAQEKDYIMDNYRFQLGNIKALANNISKVTPLSYNNKIFPFVEVYTCTDTELELFKNYLKYKSMAIESIDYLYNYIGMSDEKVFVAATMFRCENADIPTHEVEELMKELEKGVYF